MPEVVLQDYLHEINGLIDDSHLEAAVRHCRHILKQFPRHVDTYRLLGKALLEQAQLDDAADVFHRVLSADPEDFIAHAGLAIAHKQQNHLHEAAWHMERAFEVEPYNGAIRESLQDLVGRRDGLPPQQLTLTSGALARIHVQGELYAQAISDLRQLLAEESDRVDLQVLLAEALWRDGQRIDAAEECNRILAQLPDCVKAHAILGEVCLVTDRVDEAQDHLRRVFELVLPTTSSLSYDSPVGAAFRTEHSPVLPNKIPLDKATDELATDRAADAADWVQDLDLGEEFALEDAGPEWLGALQDERELQNVEVGDIDVGSYQDAAQDTPGGGSGETTDLLRRATDQLPGIGELREETDWEAWLEVEGEPVADSESGSPGDRPKVEEVGMANMDERGNDWEEFPEGEEPGEQGDAGTSGAGDDSLEWLDELQEAGQPAQEANDFETMDDNDLPDWLREGMDADDMEESELEWLDKSDETDAPVADEPAAEEGEQLPDWLTDDFGGDADEEGAEPGSDLSWLDQIAAGEGDPLEEPPTMSWPEQEAEDDESLESAWEETPEPAEAEGESDMAYAEGQPTAPEEGASEPMEDYSEDDVPEDLDEAMAWLERLAAQQGAPEDELPSLSSEAGAAEQAPEEQAPGEQARAEEAPEEIGEAMDWLDDLARAEGETEFETQAIDDVEGGEEAPELETPSSTSEEEPEGIDEAMAWLEQLADEGADGDETIFEEFEDEPDIEALAGLDELPDDPEMALAWLEGLAQEGDEGAVDEGQVVDEESTPPVPLDVVAARAEAEAILLHDQLSDADAAEETEMVEDIPDDPDEAMAWLERLAARQGASLDELPSLSDIDEDVETPDWLAEELAAAEGDEDEAVYLEAAGEIDETLYEDAGLAEPDELETELVDEVDQGAMPVDEAEGELQEAADEGGERPEDDALPDLAFGEESLEEDLPDWLDLEDEDVVDEFDWEEPAFDTSDWLRDEEPSLDVEPADVLSEPEEAFEPEAELDAEEVEALEAEAGMVAEEMELPGDSPEADTMEPVAPLEEIDVPEDETAAERAEAAQHLEPQDARQVLEAGNVDAAVDAYHQLLESRGVNVSTVIEDLEQATESFEDNPRLMQLLGDAYNQNGQLQKALDAYRKALEML